MLFKALLATASVLAFAAAFGFTGYMTTLYVLQQLERMPK